MSLTPPRDDSERLRELIAQCVGLNTMDTLLVSRKAPKVWELARSIAGEIGMDLKNPPIPRVMCSTVKNCPPNGQQTGRCQECPGKEEG